MLRSTLLKKVETGILADFGALISASGTDTDFTGFSSGVRIWEVKNKPFS